MLQTTPSPAAVPPIQAGLQPMLAIGDLHAAYGQSEVLHGLDIAAPVTGERVLVVLVTADGAENLSAALPRTPEDIEAWMARLRG